MSITSLSEQKRKGTKRTGTGTGDGREGEGSGKGTGRNQEAHDMHKLLDVHYLHPSAVVHCSIETANLSRKTLHQYECG